MTAMGARPPTPGVLMFRGWGLERRTGAEPQSQIAALRKDIEDTRKKIEPPYPYLHGVHDEEKPVNLAVSIRGNPGNLGPEVPRHFLSVLEPVEPAPFSKGSGRLELAEDILKQPLARHRQSHLEGALRNGNRRYAEQFWRDRRASDESRAARIPGAEFRAQWDVAQEAASRNHAERGISTQHGDGPGQFREGLGQSFLLARGS
jgi:hypothetical protein